jgi:hypothetical protein
VLYYVWRHNNCLSALLYLLILQPTTRFTDDPLCWSFAIQFESIHFQLHTDDEPPSPCFSSLSLSLPGNSLASLSCLSSSLQGNCWASRRQNRCSASKLFHERVAWKVVAASYSGRVTDGRVARQVSCPMRESLGKSLVESLEDLLPIPSRPVPKLVRRSQVLIA